MREGSVLVFTSDARLTQRLDLAVQMSDLPLRAETVGDLAMLDRLARDTARSAPAALVIDLDLLGLTHDNLFMGLCDLGHRFALAPILVLAPDPYPAQIVQILGCGPYGVCDKDAGIEDLAAALRLVAARRVFVPVRRIGKSVEADARGRGAPRSHAMGLTGRQSEVYDLINKGLSNKAIAHALGLSESTVKIHVNAIFHVLGVSNRVEAINALTTTN